ncbi:MAG: PH domain-containing protein [Smithellaceae bacterium]|nr:PH domain-containing protein [Smithellaceae bacterium]
MFIALLIAYWTSESAITNKRIMIKTGFISPNTFEMSHSKIESINVIQSVPGRILGYGTIVVMGTGSTRDPFVFIRDPLEFRRKFLEFRAEISCPSGWFCSLNNVTGTILQRFLLIFRFSP